MDATNSMQTDVMQTKIPTRTVKVGNVIIGGPEFTVIAGPCSIESKDHFYQTSMAVKNAGANLVRAGIWKLRTSADAFQGLGQNAFDLIKEVKKQTGMLLVSEITDPRQIDEVFDFVDMFQIGSRNMHNYSLLKEVGLVKKPILLKRGFAALIEEWIKATEYIRMGGNEDIVMCERGIRTFETATRNTLDLNAVVYVKAKTNLPVIVDPSHAIGLREFVPQLTYASAVAGADGVIVEVHPDPDKAMSDGRQSLNYSSFDDMMRQLEKILNVIGKPLQKL